MDKLVKKWTDPENASRKKLSDLLKKAKERRSVIISVSAIVLICALVVTVIALGSSLSAERRKNAAVRSAIQSRTLYTISSAKTLCDGIAKPGADVANGILPDLNCALSTLGELNSMLSQLYGSGAAIVDSSLMTKIDIALNDLQKCYSSGTNGDTALATLSGYLSELVNVLNYYS